MGQLRQTIPSRLRGREGAAFAAGEGVAERPRLSALYRAARCQTSRILRFPGS